jgi:hypothetical protein
VKVFNVGAITSIDTIYLHVYGSNGEFGSVSGKSYNLSGLTVNALVNTCSGGLQNISFIYASIKINPLSVGVHKIKVTVKDYDNFIHPGCTFLKSTVYDSLNIAIVLPNAVKKNDSEIKSVKIFPNPFMGVFKLSLEGSSEYRLSIRDNLGKVVYETDKYFSNQEIDLSFLSKGFYFLKIQNNFEQRSFKILKE